MITRKFIEKIREYFDELSIDAKNGISYDEFEHGFIKTLNRCKELPDAQLVITFYRYCSKKWNKIEKIFSKHLSKWQEYNFEGASNVENVSDEDSEGIYYVTNALTKKSKEIFLSSISLDDELYAFICKNGKFILDDDSDYYIKYSKMDSGTMKMFDKDDNLLCNIVLSKTFDIFLEKNKTEYELVIENEEDENTFIGVFEKSYIDSLGDNDYVDFKNMIADIEWDLLDAKSDLGIARITLYKDVDDMSQILYFATSTFLLYKSFNDAKKFRELAMMSIINGTLTRNLRR